MKLGIVVKGFPTQMFLVGYPVPIAAVNIALS